MTAEWRLQLGISRADGCHASVCSCLWFQATTAGRVLEVGGSDGALALQVLSHAPVGQLERLSSSRSLVHQHICGLHAAQHPACQ